MLKKLWTYLKKAINANRKLLEDIRAMKKITDNPVAELKTVGQRLRAWRKSKSLRLVDVSEKIGVSQGSLSDMENGKSLPSAGTLTGLCMNTDVNICWLLTGHGSVVRARDDKGGLFGDAELVLSLQNMEIKDLVGRLIRIFKSGNQASRSRLIGFLTGADPGN